ncbi:MAG: hypothetical protein AAGA11_19760 [Pseudomonadota bacterium]
MAVSNWLNERVPQTVPCDDTVGDHVRQFVYHKANRDAYVAFGLEYLKRKAQARADTYDVVVVGAGIHAATYLYTLRQQRPHLRVLLVEKTSTVSSTFAEFGDSLVLNSPTFQQVDLNSNVVPGHFVQTSDFDELHEKVFPTARHIFDLAVMVLLHSDADILFNVEVHGVERVADGYRLTTSTTDVVGRSVVIANGMGALNETAYSGPRSTGALVSGDCFVRRCFEDTVYADSLSGKTVAIVGDGDTANCVLEYILPIVYPNKLYGFYRENPALPARVYWLGQSAACLKAFFFNSKRRYSHSGGIIEVFWQEDSSLELPSDVRESASDMLRIVPDKLVEVRSSPAGLTLVTDRDAMDVDVAIDCTGRFNPLCARLLHDGYDTVHGDIVFQGGFWCQAEDRFVPKPHTLEGRAIACRVRGQDVFVLGGACPLGELIADSEARNGAAKYQEGRVSLTNSKWSLEHALPRTVAFAKQHAQALAARDT